MTDKQDPIPIDPLHVHTPDYQGPERRLAIFRGISLAVLPQEIRDRIITNLSYLLWDDKLRGTRFSLSCGELTWGVLLLVWGIPYHLFSRPTYKVMDEMGSELGWGILFIWSGLIQLFIVLMGDFHSRGARWFAPLNSALWVITVWGCFYSVSPPPAAMGMEAVAACAATWIVLREWIFVLAGGKNYV